MKMQKENLKSMFGKITDPIFLNYELTTKQDGTNVKKPLTKHGNSIDWSNPDNMLTFQKAYERVSNHKGLGVITGNSLCIIDLDKCRNKKTNVIAQWAKNLIKIFNAPTEISSSGTGIHIFIKGCPPELGCKFGDKTTGEVFDIGDGKAPCKIGIYASSSKWIALTGIFISECRDIPERQEELTNLCNMYWGEKATPAHSSSPLIEESTDKYLSRKFSRRELKRRHAIACKVKRRYGEASKGNWELYKNDCNDSSDSGIAMAFSNDLAWFFENNKNAMLDIVTHYFPKAPSGKNDGHWYNHDWWLKQNFKKACKVRTYFNEKYEKGRWVYDDSTYSVEFINKKLESDEKGQKIISSDTNYMRLIANNDEFSGEYTYDTFLDRLIHKRSGKEVSDNDISNLFRKAESYGLRGKIEAFYRQFFAFHKSYNTTDSLQEYIENIVWDGIPRIETAFIELLGAEDSIYTRGVTRHFFRMAVARAFSPGCGGVDTLPVFVGKQGCGKSVFVKLLSPKPEWSTLLRDVSDVKRTGEILQGKWIVEMDEMAALRRAKTAGDLKSCISSTVDRYRDAYAKNAVDHPRHCVFIGTTNDIQFLTDTTGNRRFLPVEVHFIKPFWKNKEEIRNYFDQCFAEAAVSYNNDENLTLPVDVAKEANRMQEQHIVDTGESGMIEDWLRCRSDVDKVCTRMLWIEVLHRDYNDRLSRTDSMELSAIMNNMHGWKRASGTLSINGYGKQRGWTRVVSLPQEGED